MVKKSKKDGTVTVTLTEQELGVIRDVLARGARDYVERFGGALTRADEVRVEIAKEFILITR